MDKIYQVFQNRKYVVITIVVVLLAVSTGFYFIFSKANVQKVSDIKIPTESNTKDTTSEGTPDSYIPNDQSVREDKLSTESSSTSKEGTGAKVAVPSGYILVNLTEEQKKARLEEIRNFAPVNPTKVIAKASSDPDAEELTSENQYFYPNPVFTWSGEKIQETGVKVEGYMVYFGDSHYSPDFLNEAKFQKSNTYTASNLIEGKTYYLMVRVITDSKNAAASQGFDIQGDGRPARPIFTYVYK